MSFLPAMFGLPGHFEILIIAGIALLLFGNRLPSIMGSLGKGIVEFKKGVKGIEDDVRNASSQETDSSAPPAEKQEHQESAN